MTTEEGFTPTRKNEKLRMKNGELFFPLISQKPQKLFLWIFLAGGALRK